MEFTLEEWLRCNKQVIVPKIGEGGRQETQNTRVFVAGMGAGGSASSYDLATKA
jgi:molybdopterin/thiamine biosynthesis adenylyltransferase